MADTTKLLPALITCAVLSSLSLSMAVFALIWASISARESRVLQQQVMDHEALLLREGLLKPDDYTNGPAGNLNYTPKRK